ncbi:MAG: isoleucine--tRNA ligase [Leadbetterella sp.]|nr:isoleucine--tRNA ligase [Leadbetterella sp.]
MKYPEYKSVNYAEIAEEILAFWKENNIFEKSIQVREGSPAFTFYEGPPSANGTPGIHHVMARTIKDIFCRYKTLRGFQVNRKAGWDTHGLPVELQVEKELGITKEDIGKKISVEEYNRKCREAVMRFTDIWRDMTDRMGYWVDMDNPYITYESPYIESVWSLLKKLHDKGLLYKGYTIQPYSPAAGTGLSSHELNQPGTYKDVKDTSLTAQFKAIKNERSQFLFDAAGSDNVYFLAWTTTPWTLPSNAALTVGKGIEYALVKTFNPYTFLPVYVILAKDLIGKYFNEKGKDGDFEGFETSDKKILPWTVLGSWKGAQLEGTTYEQLMPYVQPKSAAFRVIIGDFVTTEDGTGIVHTAPTFGADDYRVAAQNGIPAILVEDENGKDAPLVDRKGRFVKEVADFALEYVKEAYYTAEELEAEKQKQGRDRYLSVDERIAIKLKTENKAFNVQRYEHSYPHCWRTDKPVLYYPLDSWFIRTTAAKDKLAQLNKTINWQPESTGSGRFGNWLENLVDWNLSRSRYWGTPLPIWKNEDDEVCIGSIDELVRSVKNALDTHALSDEQRAKNEAFLAAAADKASLDLHRPYVDEIYLVSASGEVMYREADLIDVWFDSGAMPYAQWHYPFENQEIFDKAFPADFISEGVDQTRGWFFTLHAIAGMLFDSVAFKNVVSTGLVLDKNGNKMSKRLGNAIDPFKTLAQYGADPTRWYMITNAEPWDNLRFNLDGVQEVQRKLFGTLTNTYNFFALYANLDNYTIEQFNRVPREKLTQLDRWIVSRIYTLVKEVTEEFDNYNPTKAGRLIQDFVNDDLSNWYVRLNRRRFWQGEITDDKRAAYQTLQHALCAVGQLMSPIAPFYAEWLYRNLTEGVRAESIEKNTPFQYESVHFTEWHTYEPEWVDAELEEAMALAQKICSMVHALRKKSGLKVRQPLQKILIPALNGTVKEEIESVAHIIMSEVNIKEIEFITDDSGILKKKVKPNFKTLGPKFGKDMKAVAEAITGMPAEALKTLESAGTVTLSGFEIALADVEILTEDIPGWLLAVEGGLTVALDINVTAELKQEGIARDFVNRIQNLRKDSGFEVTDKIRIYLQNTDAEISGAVARHTAYISTEVQALSLEIRDTVDGAQAIDFDEQEIFVKIEVA